MKTLINILTTPCLGCTRQRASSLLSFARALVTGRWSLLVFLLDFVLPRLHSAKSKLSALVCTSLLASLAPSPLTAADKAFTLVIDAGHGGHDAGAVGRISKEKDINLQVALAFGKYVERNCPDVKVVYTRKTDKFVTLQGRADIANRAKADLFISIHTNAVAKGKTVKGFEVYTLGMHRAADNLDVAKRENSVITLESDYKSRYQGFDPNSSESYIMFEYMQDKNMENSVKLAKLIQTSVCSSAGLQNKGVHQAGFLVLRETSMPSCLIELGFISTPEEERQLNNSSVQDKIARGIFNAFKQYRDKSSVKEPTDLQGPVLPDLQSVGTAGNGSDQTVGDSAPVFKVQILASSKTLKPGDKSFKGLQDVDCYQEGGLYKYTCGSSSDFGEISRLRKTILDKFPEAFIIAFKDGVRTDVQEAKKKTR